jgi:hypothetical protein
MKKKLRLNSRQVSSLLEHLDRMMTNREKKSCNPVGLGFDTDLLSPSVWPSNFIKRWWKEGISLDVNNKIVIKDQDIDQYYFLSTWSIIALRKAGRTTHFQNKKKNKGRMKSVMDEMVSSKFNFFTQRPERLQKSTLVHGNTVCTEVNPGPW